MEDDAAMTSRYWCHMCSRSVIPVIEENEMIKCPFCQSGFVEEIDNIQDSVVTTDDDDDDGGDDDDDNDEHHHQAADSLWAPILMGMLNDQGASESSVGRRGRPLSAAIRELVQGIQAELSIESETNVDNLDREGAILINSINQRSRSGEDVVVPSGSFSDYFIGPGFEMLLQRLSENDPNRYGTPPAQKEAVEALENVKIEENLQCSVCLDEFEIGIEVKEMPCKHRFHSNCLLPWLELHSSCPVCRYQLPIEDEDEAKNEYETSSSNNNNEQNS